MPVLSDSRSLRRPLCHQPSFCFLHVNLQSGGAGVVVEPAVIAYNLEVKADVVADIVNIAEFNKASSDAQASS